MTFHILYRTCAVTRSAEQSKEQQFDKRNNWHTCAFSPFAPSPVLYFSALSGEMLSMALATLPAGSAVDNVQKKKLKMETFTGSQHSRSVFSIVFNPQQPQQFFTVSMDRRVSQLAPLCKLFFVVLQLLFKCF
jgi:hypothetical protein